jgi:hypothetical protein
MVQVKRQLSTYSYGPDTGDWVMRDCWSQLLLIGLGCAELTS